MTVEKSLVAAKRKTRKADFVSVDAEIKLSTQLVKVALHKGKMFGL